MNAIIPLSAILLAALIHATFQLGLGALLLLYHASLGKHLRRTTLRLVSAFTAGFTVMILLMLCTACFLVWVIFGGGLPSWALTAVVIALIILAVVVWVLYYRRSSRSTELWLPKPVAHYIDRRAKQTESQTEAFSLGMLASLGELPFILILLVAAASSVLDFTLIFRAPAVALYTLVAAMPLVILRLSVRRGATVVEIQKWRVKNKLFLRAISGLGFLVLAVFILAFQLMVDYG